MTLNGWMERVYPHHRKFLHIAKFNRWSEWKAIDREELRKSACNLMHRQDAQK
jgi:hypothetical protein